MSVLDPYIIPEKGVIDFVFGSGVALLVLGVVGASGVVLYKFFNQLIAKTFGKAGVKKIDSR